MGFFKRLLQPNKSPTKSIGTDSFFQPFLNGGLTYENADISEDKAGYATAYQHIVAVQRSIDLRSNAVASLDYEIRRITTSSDGDDEELISTSANRFDNYPLTRAMRRHVHDDGINFIKALVLGLDIYGEIFVEIIRDDNKRAVGLRWLNPLRVRVIREGETVLAIEYTPVNTGSMVRLELGDFAHSFEFNPFDQTRGNSRILSALNAINIARNLQRFMRDFFINNARPTTLISPPNDKTMWTNEQMRAINDNLQRFFKGSGNQFTTGVFPFSANVETFDMPDVGKIYDTNDPITREIYAAFGVPASMAGDSSVSTTYKDGDEVTKRFYLGTVYPILQRIEEFVNHCILPHFDPSPNTYFSFNMRAFEVISAQEQTLQSNAINAYQAGLITLNQARQQSGYEPLDNGDVLLVSGTPIPIEQLPNIWEHQFLVPSVEMLAGIPPPELSEPLDEGIESDAKAVRYSRIDFTPSSAMAEEAKRGLEWRREYGRGGTGIGVARARDISNKRTLAPDTVKRMFSYFSRHEVDKKGEGYTPGEKGYPSNGRIAWALWGGDVGFSWARARVSQMNTADNEKTAPHEHDHTHDHEHDHEHDDNHNIDNMVSAQPTWRRQKAYRELKAWENIVNANRLKALTFKPEYLTGYMAKSLQLSLLTGGNGAFIETAKELKVVLNRDPLEVLKSDFFRALNDDEYLASILDEQPHDHDNETLKSIGSVEGDWMARFSPVLAEIRGGGISNRRRAGDIIRQLIRVFSYRAYREGLMAGGVDGDTLDDEDTIAIDAHIKDQSAFVSNFTSVLFKEGISDDEAKQKAQLWFDGSIKPAYYMALESADTNGLYLWVTNAAESCESCDYLRGQIHRLKAWRKQDLFPTSSKLICKMACKCELVRASGKPSGSLGNVPTG